jgi:hypothetical protein
MGNPTSLFSISKRAPIPSTHPSSRLLQFSSMMNRKMLGCGMDGLCVCVHEGKLIFSSLPLNFLLLAAAAATLLQENPHTHPFYCTSITSLPHSTPLTQLPTYTHIIERRHMRRVTRAPHRT